MQGPLYRLRGASLGVLRGVSIDIPRGSVAVVGPNGSGKTTLLKLLARVAKPREGVVEGPRRVGASWQNPYLSFYKPTVREEVEDAVGDPRKAEEVLEEHGLSHVADRSPFTLSMGEARRLSILLATIWGPDALVVDEPTTGLGPGERLALAAWLRGLGIPYVMATHDLDFALLASDWLIALRGGKVVLSGPTLDTLPKAAEALGFPKPPLLAEMEGLGLTQRGAARCVSRLLELYTQPRR